jgi:hypothetical protein
MRGTSRKNENTGNSGCMTRISGIITTGTSARTSITGSGWVTGMKITVHTVA